MARRPQSKRGGKTGAWSKKSSSTGRAASKGTSREAAEFADRFTRKYRETLRELSKH